MKTLRLSHSQIDKLTSCGVAWKFRYLDRIKKAPASGMLRGRAVDKAVQRNLENKRDNGTLLPLEEVQDIASDTLRNEWEGGVALDEEELEAGERAVKGEITDQVVRMAATHATQVAPKLFPVGVQERFDVEIKGYDCHFVGYRDVREANGFTRDTKTSKKKPSGDEADTSTQLTLYALAHKVEFGEYPRAVVLDYLVNYVRKPDEAFSLYSSRGPEQFAALLRRIEAAVESIRAGIFIPADPSSWKCSSKWCEFWGDCPYAMRPVSVPVDQQLTKIKRRRQE